MRKGRIATMFSDKAQIAVSAVLDAQRPRYAEDILTGVHALLVKQSMIDAARHNELCAKLGRIEETLSTLVKWNTGTDESHHLHALTSRSLAPVQVSSRVRSKVKSLDDLLEDVESDDATSQRTVIGAGKGVTPKPKRVRFVHVNGNRW